MKNIYCLLFLLFACSPAGTAQADECLPNEQRQLINDMVAANRFKYGIRKENGDKLLPNAYIWPVVPSPTTNAAGVSSICQFVDHDPSSGLLDWNCGNRTYDGHRGTDICNTPYPWYMVEHEEAHVVAMAGGTILWKMDGNDSYSCDFSRPDWNGVGIQHSDGSTAWYGHLKENSLTTKSVGQSVASGEYLGVMASSGMSTGPHLHIEIYDTDGNLVDPYAGSCNALNPSTSYWQDQPEYHHPGINRVMVQSAPTDYGPDCNSVEDPNYLEQANAGDVIHYRMVFSGVSAGTSATYRLTAPDGSTLLSQTNNYNSNGFSTFFGNSFTLPNDLVTGNYRFEATYLGVTVDYEFEVMGNSSCNGSTAIVSNTNDSGPGSLREAINCVNSNSTVNQIHFSIAGVGPHIITLSSALPNITDDNTIIDATTQPGWSLGDIQLDAGGLPGVGGFLVSANGFELYGLWATSLEGSAVELLWTVDISDVIIGAPGKSNVFGTNNPAVQIIRFAVGNSTGSNNIVQNNYIGVTPDGIDVGGLEGVRIGRSGSTVRNNIVANSRRYGVLNDGSSIAVISQNSLYCNESRGIINNSLALSSRPAPTLTTVSVDLITGTASSTNGIIEFFIEGEDCSDCNDGAPQGKYFLGSLSLNGSSIFTMMADDFLIPLNEGDRVVATYTLGEGTSSFSTCLAVEAGGCTHEDYDALMALYNSTNGSEWSNRSGWEEGFNNESCDPCNYNGSPWYGVTCRNGRIRTLFLGSNNLSGVLPTELGMLSTVETIDLARNDIGGTLPTSVGNLSSIERLFLGENNFEGLIPTSIGQLNTAVVIGLNTNSFSGGIPVSISQLTSLEQLSLSRNQLTGGIPPALGQMSSIEQLNLSLNPLGGEIPEELGQATQLFQLGLASNQLTGCLPNFVVEACTNTLNIDLTNNPELPYSGSFSNFCQSLNSVGAPCNDSNPVTTNDAIDSDCNCVGELPATCDDGLQNGDEEGVDCGGSNCAPCTIPCNETNFSYQVSMSAEEICLGEEVTATFTLNATGNPPYSALVSGNGLPVNIINDMPGDGTSVSFTFTPTATSDYTISNVQDAEGCRSNPAWVEFVFVGEPVSPPTISCIGSTLSSASISFPEDPAADGYTVSVNGGIPETVTGGAFTATGLSENTDVSFTVTALGEFGCPDQSTTITCRTLAATCDDGLQNGDEEGVDCGGSNCVPCSVPCDETGYTYSIEASDLAVCRDTEITLSLFLNAENGNPPYQLTVSGPDGTPTIYDHPGDGSVVTFSATPVETGLYQIEELLDGSGCSYTTPTTVAVTVEAPIAEPVLTCVEVTQSTITISWEEDPAATRYELYVNGVGPEPVTGGTYNLDNLSPDEVVSFDLVAIHGSPCPDPFGFLNCQTLADPCAGDSPVVNTPTTAALCAYEGIVDLSVLEGEVLLGQTATVEWFLDAAGGEFIVDPQNFAPATAPFTVYVRVTNTDCSSEITPITLDQIAPQVPSFAALPTMLCYDDPVYPLPQPTDGTIGTWTLSGEGITTAINPALYGSTTLSLVFEPDSSAGDCLTLFEHEIIVTEPAALNFSLSADTVCTDFGLVATVLGEDAGATEITWSGVPEPDSIVTQGNTATFYFAEAGNAVITGQRMINDCAGEPLSRTALVESCQDCVRLIDCIPQFGQSASLVMIDTFVNVGESVCIPILVADLTGFVDLGFSLQWDPEVFSFVEVNNVVPELGAIPIVATPYQPGEVAINVASAESGTLSFYWRSFGPEDDCTLAPVLTFQEPIPLFEICLQATQAPLEPETNLAFVNQPQAVTGNKPNQCQNEGDALVVGFGASAVLNGNCEHPDYAALMAFYESTNGPEWNTKTGWEAGALGESCDPCNYNGGTWFGVICGQQGRVTNLNLLNNNLTGQIPGVIGGLDSLLRLDLRRNGLRGEIPQELGRLSKLWGLFLQNNRLAGNISDSLENIEGLRVINLSFNQFSGQIPTWIGNINSLISLDLSVNELGGVIPTRLGNLSSLENLNLGFNELVGPIPPEIGMLTALETLILSANNLSSSIPASLGNLESVTWIDLAANDLSGCFPDELQIFCDLGPFDQATFTGYNFSGNPKLPFFGMYESVCAGEEQVGAICNDLAGTETEVILEDCSCREEVVSCDHPDFPALMALYENTNGSIWTNQTGWAEAANGEACDPCNFNGVPWYGITCDQGRVICVDLDGNPDCSPNGGGGNGLTGGIPQTFFELDSVQCLSFAGQGITGELPPDYTGVPSVRCFSFVNTDLQGEVPAGVSTMTNVRRFILEDGDFSGPFPEGLQGMSDLQDISITFSDISGPLPAWLGNLASLRQLFLAGNNLRGEIPAELGQLDSLITFFAQDNVLEGPIPDEIAQMESLRELALSRNRLNGDLPLGILDLPNLEFLYLYGNQLTGDIGEIITRVNGLQALYLDSNNLTGCYELNEELCESPEVTTFRGNSTFDGENYVFYNENGYNFSNNNALPLEGSYAAFCNGEEQVGSACNDGDSLTENDVITTDCGCQGQLITNQPIILTISDADGAPGEEIEITFTADTLNDIASFQFAFTYETELLELVDVSGEIAGIDVLSITSVPGEVISLWAPFASSTSGRDVELLTATFFVLDSCSTEIRIDNAIRPIEFSSVQNGFSNVDITDTGIINGEVDCCSDGFQNGSETGVDCGGTNCVPCECTETDLTIFNGSITPASCSAANGSAAVIIMGGVPPYVYEWSNGATTAVNDNLLPGDYFVTVTDSLGCSVTNLGNPARILDNSPIVPICPGDLFFTVDANADSLIFEVVPPVIGDCTDEGLRYEVSGATELSGQGIPEALVLNLGTSILTFTTGIDSCSYSITVEQPTVDCSDLLIISLESRTPVCYDDSTGLIDVEFAGGSGNYAIQWSSGQTVEDLQDLTPGVYVLDLVDLETECTVTAGFWLQSPDSIQMECIVIAEETLTNAIVSFSGVVLPVTLDLSGVSGDRVEDLSAMNYEFTDLAPGLYEVLLTDANGCQEFCSFEVLAAADPCEDPTNLPQISLDPLNSYAICPGQSTQLELLLENNQIVEWRSEPDGTLVGTASSLTVSTAATYSFSITDTIIGCSVDSFVTIIPDQRMPIVVCPEDTTVLLNLGQFSSVTVSSGVPELVFAPCDDIAFPPAEDLELTETDTYTWEYQSNNGQGGTCQRTINVIRTDTMTIYVDEPNIYRRGPDTLMIPIAIRNWSSVASFIFDLEATDQTAGGVLIPIAMDPNPAFLEGIDIELLSPTRIRVTWTAAPGVMDVPSDFRLLELPLVVNGNPGDCVNLHFGTTLDNAATAMMGPQQIYLSTVDGLACLPLVASMSGNVFRLRPDLTVAPLRDVTLELRREVGTTSSVSREDGTYSFGEQLVNESYEIVPFLADDFRRGIDLLDVVLLRDICMNYDNPVSISTPYQLIAADVFPDCEVNFIDLTFEVQMMLGGIDSFPGNTAWRFIPSAFEFPEEYMLCEPNFPESIVYAPLVEDEPFGDFIGVKTGDLSLNATSPLLEGITEIEIDDQLFQAGDTVRIPIGLGEGEIAAAIYYQYDISSLSYLPAHNKVNEQSFRLNYSNKAGEIDQVLIDVAGEDELVFIANKNGQLSRVVTLGEGSRAVSHDRQFKALDLRWKEMALNAKSIEFSVFPNPFFNQLSLQFANDLSTDTEMTVRDLTGRTLYQSSLPAGVNRYVFETVTQKWPAGVYIITVENGLHAQQKMIVKK